MKKPVERCRYYFVDESGDPTFYDANGNLIVGKEGCSKMLILGYISTEDPHAIRTKLASLKDEIAKDPIFSGVPSMKQTLLAFHATDDLPEVRFKVYETLKQLDFAAQIIVGRKQESQFRKKFKANENAFYDYLVSRLFENVLHTSTQNRIYFSKRGDKNRQKPLMHAVQEGVGFFEEKWKAKVDVSISVQAQTPSGEPCLQVTDYILWAVYRAYTKGEMRFFNAIADKVELLNDIFDTVTYPNIYYHKLKNPFDIKKTSPL